MSNLYNTFVYVVSVSLLAVLLLFSVSTSHAQPLPQINYQGKLTTPAGVAVIDTSYDMTFRLYTTSTGGVAIWTETLTGANQVDVVNGLFSVMLGSTTPLTSVDFDQPLYLGVEVSGDGEMTPRKPFGTVPAAFVAHSVSSSVADDFLSATAADTMAATEAGTLLTINQSGTGDILNLLDDGAEVFTVTDGGNVGIGTTTPSSLFAVSNGVNDIFAVDGATGEVQILSRMTSGGAGGQFEIRGGSVRGGGFNITNTSIDFLIGDDVEMVLTGDNLGIGTTSPYAKLSVDGDLTFDNTGAQVATSTQFFGPDGSVSFGTTSLLAAYTFDTSAATGNEFLITDGSGSTEFVVTNEGLVGIQNGDPNAVSVSANDLVIGSATGHRGISLISGSTQTGNIFFGDTLATGGNSRTGQIQYDHADNSFQFTTNGNEAVRIDSAGNVGIGTTSPYAKLSVDGDFGFAAAGSESLFTDGGASTYLTSLTDNFAIGTTSATRLLEVYGAANAGGRFIDSTNDVTVDIRAEDFQGFVGTVSNSDLRFITNNVSRMTLDTNGNLGIGTTTANEKLTVAGNGLFEGVVMVATGTQAAPSFTFGSDPSTGLYQEFINQLDFTVGGAAVLALDAANLYGAEMKIVHNAGDASEPTYSFTPDEDTGIFRAGSDNLGFSTAGNEAFRVNEDGVVLVGATTTPDYATTTTRLAVAGGITSTVGDPLLVGSVVSGITMDVPFGVDVQQGYAYVTSLGSDSVTVVDVNDPANPAIIGFVSSSTALSGPRDIEVVGKYAYVAASSHFTILDISNPSDPQIVSALADPSSAWGLTVVGDKAYIADRNTDLRVVDISDPLNPFEIVSFSDGSLSNVNDIEVRGNYAYTANEDSDSVAILDISDLNNISIVGDDVNGTLLNTVAGLDLDGQYMYTVSYSGNSVVVHDVSDPTNPTVVGSLTDTLFAGGNKIMVSGKYAYVAAEIANALTVVDVSDPANMKIVGSHQDAVELAGAVSLDVYGNHVYVTPFGVDRLSIFNVGGITGANAELGTLLTDRLDVTKLFAHSGNFGNTINVGEDAFVHGGLTVSGNTRLAGALFDSTNASGTAGMILQSTSDGTQWVATSSLGFGGGSLFTDSGANTYLTSLSDNFGIGTTSPSSKLDVWGDVRVGSTSNPALYVDATNEWVGVQTASPIGAFQVGAWDGSNVVGQNAILLDPTGTQALQIHTSERNAILEITAQNGDFDSILRLGGASDAWRIGLDDDDNDSLKISTDNGLTDAALTITQNGNLGIGTTTPTSALSIENLTFDDNGISGISQYLTTTNSVASAVQFGNYFELNASNTATTTIVGSILRVADDTTFGNTVRGLEVQTNRGGNTQGENTALSGFARTFGVRGVTSGDAGSSFEPAGGFFETEGTTQGNAVRGFSSSITSASLLSLFQDTSDFTGTGLEMNFGNTTGDFSSSSSKYLDFQNAGTSVFTVSAFGTTTIGDGTTNNMAGLQIGYGGICVDNDGTCTATTTGRITSVESQTGNSDLAEMYFSDQDLEPGEVVVLRDELSIRRATTDTSLPILGVVSTKPGLTLGFDDQSTRAGETGYPLALSGRVPVRLSNENGPIQAGDTLMLSSLPGIAMKSDGTGTTIGIALEDFNENRMYSDTYINQFGDDIATPDFTPITTNTDPRINDGCYFGGGNEAGADDCVPLESDTVDEQVAEANEIEAAEALEDALFDLRYVTSDTEILEDGAVVSVGQIVMFVERAQPTLSTDQLATLGALLSTSTIIQTEAEDVETEPQTLLARLTELADGFVGGVLSVFEIRADRVEVAEELCVDGVCVTADDLRTILDAASAEPIVEIVEIEVEVPVEVDVVEEEAEIPEVVEESGVDIEPTATSATTTPEDMSAVEIVGTDIMSETANELEDSDTVTSSTSIDVYSDNGEVAIDENSLDVPVAEELVAESEVIMADSLEVAELPSEEDGTDDVGIINATDS